MQSGVTVDQARKMIVCDCVQVYTCTCLMDHTCSCKCFNCKETIYFIGDWLATDVPSFTNCPHCGLPTKTQKFYIRRA